MDRLSVEKLLREYVDALDLASRKFIPGNERYEYQPHHSMALNLLARWQGGESEEGLRAAVSVELADYRKNPPGGPQAETVGTAFGAVCSAVAAM
jgi:hypothetical protein